MTSDQKFQWMSFISILIGFGLIIWELQQSRAMTAAVIANDGSIARAELDMQIASYADVYLKACREDGELSQEDQFKLIQIFKTYYEIRVNRLINYQSALETGVDWRGNAERFFYFMFDTAFGRQHWLRIREDMRLDIKDIGDEILETIAGKPSCFSSLGDREQSSS